MRVRGCLRDLLLVAVRRKVSSRSLQPLPSAAVWHQCFRRTFNPKVAGSRPARPIENAPYSTRFLVRPAGVEPQVPTYENAGTGEREELRLS